MNDPHQSYLTPTQKRTIRDFNRYMIVLFFILLTLKLAQVGVVQHWSWYYVTMPLWLPSAALFAAWLIISVLIFIFKLILNKL